NSFPVEVILPALDFFLKIVRHLTKCRLGDPKKREPPIKIKVFEILIQPIAVTLIMAVWTYLFSLIKCGKGVDCQSNGFDTSYKRILRSMPMNEISYRSVYRVALIFIGQKNKKLDKIRTCNFKAVNDLQCLIIGINALEGGVEKVCDRILMDAFKSCWREQRRPGKFLEAFRKASYYGKEQIHSANYK
uniref:Uncharacterized protein n=1 Tax=Romanomermis culicivorax TaxID=13658 RepID=A0A915J890_ROMCU